MKRLKAHLNNLNYLTLILMNVIVDIVAYKS
jgi:hypothetical protein